MKTQTIEMHEIQGLNDALNEIKNRIEQNETVNFQSILRKNGVNKRYFESALELKYFERLEPNKYGVYKCNIERKKQFEPWHARKIIKNYYTEKKKCPSCGQYFTADPSYKKYCSASCSVNSQRLKKDTDKQIKKCKNCGNIFSSHHSHQIFCSAECRKEWYDENYFKSNTKKKKSDQHENPYSTSTLWAYSSQQLMDAIIPRIKDPSTLHEILKNSNILIKHFTDDRIFEECKKRGYYPYYTLSDKELIDELKRRGCTGSIDKKIEL